ncbi:L-type lectin-domain containing protein [Uliginosibacterium sp. H3]|uniref:L-type lectin-domain containing protein n=1 Tax=Uliginosibacterium silvisoli TaxID=3114758 RepID=A0ABU6KBB8_9RHOO|nr:L-type lectin-domain containing protein [Uliginosibacterium sp. H3]
MKRFLSRILPVAVFAAFANGANADVIVNYPDFSDTSALSLVGSAATASTGDGQVLRVTPAAGGLAGAAYSNAPITLGAGNIFSSSFQFRLTSPGGWDPADGFTFVLASNTAGLGGAGVGMGYAGVGNSVAIEFDTYNNTGYGLGADDGVSSNHVSIDTNGVLTNTALANVYGNGSCGFTSGGYPNQNDYTVAGCMSNGNLWTAVIGYDGMQLSVSLFDPGLGYWFKAIENYAIDVAALLGTNQAYVGFTASTGAGWENHDIVNWQFANTTELVRDIPEPSSLGVLALCMLAIAHFLVRRRTPKPVAMPR